MKRLVFLAFLLVSGPVGAAEATSAYTPIDIEKDCVHRPGKEPEDYGDWRCNGYAGLPIQVSAGDQRMFVSFGPRAEREPAAAETLTPMNDFYKGTIEWRLADGRPVSAIMRWNYKTEADRERREATGRVLAVTRLPPGPVCHVGYVDARANPDANELAREIADKTAKGFVCGRDTPVILGKVGPGAAFK
jgi:hypothetical protein